MPLRKRAPSHSDSNRSVLASIPASCRYCKDSRAVGYKHRNAISRLKSLFSRNIGSSAVCHACGTDGQLKIEFRQVNWTGDNSNSIAERLKEQHHQHYVGTSNRTSNWDEGDNEYASFGDCSDDDDDHDFCGSEQQQRTRTNDLSFVERWLADQQPRAARFKRWLRCRARSDEWSRRRLIQPKPGRRPPPPFISSAPHGLEPIPEVEEPVESRPPATIN